LWIARRGGPGAPPARRVDMTAAGEGLSPADLAAGLAAGNARRKREPRPARTERGVPGKAAAGPCWCDRLLMASDVPGWVSDDPREGAVMSEIAMVGLDPAKDVFQLAELVEAEDDALPATARATLQVLVDGPRHLDERIAELDAEIARRAREDELARRPMTIPGIGPLIATAPAALAPPPEHFRRARDFAAWLGLTPRQHSTGGKVRPRTPSARESGRMLGAMTRMGERSLGRLLILGVGSVVIRRQTNPMAQPGTWLGDLLARKPGMLVRLALAGGERQRATGSSAPRAARIVRALMARGRAYGAPAAAA
jgi:hypothetical protein